LKKKEINLNINNVLYCQLDVTPMVQDAKKVASNIRDQPSIGKWRDSNQKLLDSVGKVRKAVAGPEPIPDVSALNLSKTLLRGKTCI